MDGFPERSLRRIKADKCSFDEDVPKRAPTVEQSYFAATNFKIDADNHKDLASSYGLGTSSVFNFSPLALRE
jgi:hypothetical protein